MKKRINSIMCIVTIIIIMLTLSIAYIKRNEIVWVKEILPITDINTDKKVVAIACNVYEGNEELKKIIGVLNQEKVKISFFLGGVWAKTNPDMVLMLINNGQDIQNHGYYHRKPSTLNQENNIKEIKNTEELIYKIGKVRTNIFEPPFGDYDENSLNIVNKLGYKAVTWSIDTIDWREDATQTLILNRIQKKLHPGAIILIHPKPVTSSSIESIIKLLKSREYEIKTVSELIQN